MIFCVVLWCSMMFYDVLWCFMMFYDVLWCSLMFYDVLWCSWFPFVGAYLWSLSGHFFSFCSKIPAKVMANKSCEIQVSERILHPPDLRLVAIQGASPDSHGGQEGGSMMNPGSSWLGVWFADLSISNRLFRTCFWTPSSYAWLTYHTRKIT